MIVVRGAVMRRLVRARCRTLCGGSGHPLRRAHRITRPIVRRKWARAKLGRTNARNRPYAVRLTLGYLLHEFLLTFALLDLPATKKSEHVIVSEVKLPRQHISLRLGAFRRVGKVNHVN